MPHICRSTTYAATPYLAPSPLPEGWAFLVNRDRIQFWIGRRDELLERWAIVTATAEQPHARP